MGAAEYEPGSELYLGSVRHSVPVASRQAEVTVAYSVQDLIGGVLRSVGKWSKTDGRKVGVSTGRSETDRCGSERLTAATHPASMV